MTLCARAGAQPTRLAAQLVAAWAELRQVEALLASLRAAVVSGGGGGGGGGGGVAIKEVLCAPAFLAALAQVCTMHCTVCLPLSLTTRLCRSFSMASWWMHSALVRCMTQAST